MDSKYKELNASQLCSQYVTYLSKALRDPSKENIKKDFSYLATEYAKIISFHSKDNVEKTIFNMLRTNNDMVELFNRNRTVLKETIDELVNPNCRGKDFLEQITDLYTFIKEEYDSTYQLKENKALFKVKKNKDIKEVYKTGVLDWNFVKKQFSDKLDFWKVKEANAWLVCFVEKCDYELDDIIVKQENGFANKQKTFDNLINKVNEAAITKKNPFSKGKYNLFFNAADSGEVDVLLWNPKKERVIGASATRDRSYKVEGNQFFRHYLRSYVLNKKIEHGFFIQEKKSGHRSPKNCKNVQALVRNESFQNYDYAKEVFKLERNNVKDQNIIDEIDQGNEFSKDLSLYRIINKKILGVNFSNNGHYISEGEVATMGLLKNGVDFVFYGETLEHKSKPNIRAGLNCLAYRDNFKRIGTFEMTGKAGNILLNAIDKRFNGVDINEANVELQSQKYIIDTMKEAENVDKMIELMSMFSTGNVQQDERACLFKACAIFFKGINKEIKTTLFKMTEDDSFELKRNTFDKTIENGIKAFFNAGIDSEDFKAVKDFISDDDKIRAFARNLNRIRIPNSEVPMEYDEFKNNADTTLILKNAFKDKIENLKLKKELQELKEKNTNVNKRRKKP